MDWLYRRLFPGECTDAYVYYFRAIDAALNGDGPILDLGCGDNRSLEHYRRSRPVWGTDFHTHPHLSEPAWFRALEDRGRIPFASAMFQVVASRWVLEHVEYPRRFLHEVSRVLRPGGAFVSLTINAGHYVTWLTRLLHLLPHAVTQRLVERLYGRPSHDTFPTFYRLNTRADLHRHGRSADLELASIRAIVNPDYFRFSRLTLGAAMLADWMLDVLRPGHGRIYWVITMRKPAAVCGPAQLAA